MRRDPSHARGSDDLAGAPEAVAAVVHRRRFMELLVASPLLGCRARGASSDALADGSVDPPRGTEASAPEPAAAVPAIPTRAVPRDPSEALSVLDLERAAERALPPAHFGYLKSGVGDEVTLHANREGFASFVLRPHRLVDASAPDLSTSLLGATWGSPIALAPTGSNACFHPEAEVAVARAARVGDHLMILSGLASSPLEEVARARGRELWLQVPLPPRFEMLELVLPRAEAAGCMALVVTVDRVGSRRMETYERYRALDRRDCSACHEEGRTIFETRPLFEGLDVARLTKPAIAPDTLRWDVIERLRSATALKLVIKGILTAEDAERCVAAGADAVIVSNHGGRAEDHGMSTIESLDEVARAVGGRIPLLVDGGFRRGTDVLKALALGASAVCIGRPYLWGLGAFGQAGVERALELLREELRVLMQQLGAPSIRSIDASFVGRAWRSRATGDG